MENFILDPENDSVYPWRSSFPSSFYGCLYLISQKVAEELSCRHAIHNMLSENLLVGVTSMHQKAGWMIKVLAGDPYEFRKAMKRIGNSPAKQSVDCLQIFVDIKQMHKF